MLRSLAIRFALKLPKGTIDNILLKFPFLYKTKLVNFESGVALDDLQKLIDIVEEVKNLPGEIIECGSNRCGTTVILAKYLQSHGIEKKLFALDSFSGFDPQELNNERKNRLTDFATDSYHYNSYDYVIKKIHKLDLTDRIFPVKGYFEETLPNMNYNFCMAFIDCDLAKSMTFAAEQIWPKLVDNGIILFHDYDYEHFQGVKPAVDNFVERYKNQIENHYPIHGSYYVKKKSKNNSSS